MVIDSNLHGENSNLIDWLVTCEILSLLCMHWSGFADLPEIMQFFSMPMKGFERVVIAHVNAGIRAKMSFSSTCTVLSVLWF